MRFQVSGKGFQRRVRIGPGRNPQIQPGAGTGLNGGRRADHRRDINTEHGQRRPCPEHIRDGPAAQQLDAVEHAGIGAEPIARRLRAVPDLIGRETRDRGVSCLVAQGGEQMDQFAAPAVRSDG